MELFSYAVAFSHFNILVSKIVTEMFDEAALHNWVQFSEI